MRPLNEFSAELRRGLRFVLTDIDDTLTLDGLMPSAVFAAMERLGEAGLVVIPVTGRPAGWCDHIARMWPVDAIVGENGAFYFSYDRADRKMVRHYWKSAGEREADRRRLADLGARILDAVPDAAISADQGYREADLAIDHCEDIAPLPEREIDRIAAMFEEAGATAKVSSIHVCGWFGDYDKLTMTRVMLTDLYGLDAESALESVVFVGDSPNDAPMFAHFPHSVGVANVRDFAGRIAAEPTWVTEARGGHGFVELADALIAARE
jgi:HAD superfamily hydrolase (TIGR01484 family)